MKILKTVSNEIIEDYIAGAFNYRTLLHPIVVITVDTTPPIVTFALNNGVIIPTISELNSTWQLYVEGVLTGGQRIDSFDLKDLDLPAGSYNITITATDSSNNTSLQTSPQTFSISDVDNQWVEEYNWN